MPKKSNKDIARRIKAIKKTAAKKPVKLPKTQEEVVEKKVLTAKEKYAQKYKKNSKAKKTKTQKQKSTKESQVTEAVVTNKKVKGAKRDKAKAIARKAFRKVSLKNKLEDKQKEIDKKQVDIVKGNIEDKKELAKVKASDKKLKAVKAEAIKEAVETEAKIIELVEIAEDAPVEMKAEITKEIEEIQEFATLQELDKEIEILRSNRKNEITRLRAASLTQKEFDVQFDKVNSKFEGLIENLVQKRHALEQKSIDKKNVGKNKDAKADGTHVVAKKKLTVSQIAKNNRTPRPGKIDTPMMNEKNVIECRDVVKFYTTGKVAFDILKGVSVDIERGDFAMLFGKSGSGKSTLLNIMSGLDRVTTGGVVINSKDISKMKDYPSTKFRRKNMGFIFQRYNLLPNLNAYENAETGAFLQKDRKKRLDIKELFKMMEIDDVMYKYPSEMSGGQQQRVSIARALVKNPDILFADEPTGALDEKVSEAVLKILKDINKKYGTTIVMVTHNPALEPLASRVIRLKSGKVEKVTVNKNPVDADKIQW